MKTRATRLPFATGIHHRDAANRPAGTAVLADHFQKGAHTFPDGARTFANGADTFFNGARTFANGVRTFAGGVAAFLPASAGIFGGLDLSHSLNL